MADFHVRSDSVNVEQIMDQIRARIRDKRGVDYTEQEIHELASVKLERFLDPRGVRSELLDEFRRTRSAAELPALPNYAFDDTTLFDTHRAPIRWIRRILRPILKLFFNPNPLIQALHIQSRLNAMEADREGRRRVRDQLTFEVLHNLVVETTRLGIEVKNLKMRVESLTGRLEFNERRTRALEGAVVYKPAGEEPTDRGPAGVGAPAAQPGTPAEGPGQRSRRRRRRRGRRGRPAAALLGGAPSLPARSGQDDNAAREAGETHAGTAETVEQAMAVESHPAEEPSPFDHDDDDSDQ